MRDPQLVVEPDHIADRSLRALAMQAPAHANAQHGLVADERAVGSELPARTRRWGTLLPGADNAGRYLELMRVDKKAEAGEIKFVLIDKPGRAIVRSAPDAFVRLVIDTCCA